MARRDDAEEEEKERNKERLREIARQDQALEATVDTVISNWWLIYCKCKEKGFNDQQSLTLLRTWIRSK